MVVRAVPIQTPSAEKRESTQAEPSDATNSTEMKRCKVIKGRIGCFFILIHRYKVIHFKTGLMFNRPNIEVTDTNGERRNQVTDYLANAN